MHTAAPTKQAGNRGPMKIVCHSSTVLNLARQAGWYAGASYVRLRDIRGIKPVGFIDIDWKNYDFKRHLKAVKDHRPLVTVANDLVCLSHFDRTLEQAYELLEWAKYVVVVPKDMRLGPDLAQLIPKDFVVGYSVPTRFGGTRIPLEYFRRRRIHLLGGRPDVQRKLADSLNVFSLDVNRFTLDAKFGDYFDGEMFRPHPLGGYHRCLRDSIRNIEALWDGYRYAPKKPLSGGHEESDTVGLAAGEKARRGEL